ncbi:MAG TPA: ornithine cyclodeaminase family protein [Ideonella sp.]|nr:ornithine cyclodeaminase family protein [Ideonella sp.]
MQFIDAPTTRRALAFGPLIAALRQMFVQGCEVPPRHTHTLQPPAGPAMTVLIMPAWQPDAYLGIKTVNIAPGNAARGLPGLHASYLLYDARSGVPLAQIDGNEITARRTAAASALAAAMLARPDSRKLLIVGAGRVAALLAEAYRAVLPIEEVMVWSRRPDSAAALVDALVAAPAEWQIAARVAPDLAAAAAQADVVSCATLATEPVLQGAWLRPGCHLDLIGSFTPAMREADDDCFRGARLFVDTEEALLKSGELLGPMSRGVFRREDLAATLAQLCRGERPGRGSATERTVFKSVGTALEDLAAARLVYETVA